MDTVAFLCTHASQAFSRCSIAACRRVECYFIGVSLGISFAALRSVSLPGCRWDAEPPVSSDGKAVGAADTLQASPAPLTWTRPRAW